MSRSKRPERPVLPTFPAPRTLAQFQAAVRIIDGYPDEARVAALELLKQQLWAHANYELPAGAKRKAALRYADELHKYVAERDDREMFEGIEQLIVGGVLRLGA